MTVEHRWDRQAEEANSEKKGSTGIDELIRLFAVTEMDVMGIRKTEFAYKKVIPRGHMIAIAGLPGAGKTTIMEFVAARISGTVLYINGDISASDIPEAKNRATTGGYKLLAPDIKFGRSMDDIILRLSDLSQSETDLADVTIIIDTLKKITEVISKGASATMYKMLRSLTGRGATVICLSHCNKYPDQNGWPMYEGTSDLRSDFDELALLHAHKGDYGEVTASLYWADQGCPWAKARAFVQPQSWLIDVEENRTVSELDEWVDTVSLGKERHEAMQTADVIREVHSVLMRHGPMNQTDILERLKNVHGERIVKRVLRRQEGVAWNITQGEHNARIHEAIPDAEIPAPKVVRWEDQLRKK
jgi:hypothetical protein